MTTRNYKNTQSSKKRQKRFKQTTLVYDKYITTTYNAIAISDTPTLLDLTDIAQGVDLDQRLSYTVKITTIHFHLEFTASSADGYNTIRLMVAQAYNPDAVVGDLPDTLYEVIDPKRFKTLDDRLIPLTTYGSLLPKVVEFIVRPQVQTRYFNANGTGVISGRLMYVFLSDSGAVTHPTVTGSIVVSYRDKL